MIHNAYVADVTYPPGSGKKNKTGVALTVGGAPLDPDQMALFVESRNLFPGAASVKIREVEVPSKVPKSLAERVEMTKNIAAREEKRTGKKVALTPKVHVDRKEPEETPASVSAATNPAKPQQ